MDTVYTYSITCYERPLYMLYWTQKCGLSRQVVSGDRFSYIEMWFLLPKMCGLSRQVVSHGSGQDRFHCTCVIGMIHTSVTAAVNQSWYVKYMAGGSCVPKVYDEKQPLKRQAIKHNVGKY